MSWEFRKGFKGREPGVYIFEGNEVLHPGRVIYAPGEEGCDCQKMCVDHMKFVVNVVNAHPIQADEIKRLRALIEEVPRRVMERLAKTFGKSVHSSYEIEKVIGEFKKELET